MLNVSLSLPGPRAPRTKRFEAIIDSGATRCLFHADLASFLGLDLLSGHRERTQGIGGSANTWIHRVSLYLPGGPVEVHAAFKDDLPIAGLLGMNGFFEHYVVTFHHPSLHCDLERLPAPQA